MTLQRLDELADKYIEENENTVMPDYFLKRIKEAVKFGYRTAQSDIYKAIQEPLSMLP